MMMVFILACVLVSTPAAKGGLLYTSLNPCVSFTHIPTLFINKCSYTLSLAVFVTVVLTFFTENKQKKATATENPAVT